MCIRDSVVQQNSTINRGPLDWIKKKLGMGKKKAPAPPNEWDASQYQVAGPTNRGAIPRQQRPLPAIPGARENEYAEINSENDYEEPVVRPPENDYEVVNDPEYEQINEDNYSGLQAGHTAYGTRNADYEEPVVRPPENSYERVDDEPIYSNTTNFRRGSAVSDLKNRPSLKDRIKKKLRSSKDWIKKKLGMGNDPEKYTDKSAGKRFGKQGKGLTTAEFERESAFLSSGDEKLWKKNGYTKSLSDMQDYVSRNTREIAKRKTNEGTELDPFKQKDVAPESLIHNAFKKWTNGGGLTIKDKVMMCYLSFEQKLGSEDDPPFRIGHFMSSENYDYKNTKKHTEGMWDKTVDTGRLSTIPENILSTGEKKQALETAEIVKNVMDLVDKFQSLDENVKPKKDEVVAEKVGARELFSHGGRVNIKVPKLGEGHSDGTAITDAIGLTDKGEMRKGEKGSELVHSRTAATHGTRFSWDGKESKEQGGWLTGGSNWLTKGNKTWGLDLAIGGAGNLDYNGKVIKCDGSHGHLMINWTAPTAKTHGVLMVGVETTGMGAKSQDGYKHSLWSSEKTANLMSTAGGLKKEKNNSGASQSLGMHVVDLREMDRSMKDLLAAARKAKEPLPAIPGVREPEYAEINDAEDDYEVPVSIGPAPIEGQTYSSARENDYELVNDEEHEYEQINEDNYSVLQAGHIAYGTRGAPIAPPLPTEWDATQYQVAGPTRPTLGAESEYEIPGQDYRNRMRAKEPIYNMAAAGEAKDMLPAGESNYENTGYVKRLAEKYKAEIEKKNQRNSKPKK